MDQSKCNIAGCNQEPEYITTSETAYIELCKEHWYDKYKKWYNSFIGGFLEPSKYNPIGVIKWQTD